MVITMDEKIWLDLLNSDWHDYIGSGRREDRLDNPDWLSRYLARHRIDAAGVPRDRLISSLRELRSLLRRIADAYAGRRQVRASDWAAINLYFSRAPLIRKVEESALHSSARSATTSAFTPASSALEVSPRPGAPNARPRLSTSPVSARPLRSLRSGRPRLSLIPLSGRLESLLAEIARSFVETLAERDASRIKICRNADCLWIFYDRSKNKSRKWCEDTCGNLMKVRRFRKRHRAI